MDKSKNIIIGALLVAIMAMSIGYAALAQRLDINATANIDASWKIEFTDINNTVATGATVHETPSVNGTSATFEVDLAYPGATATFDITVKNSGSIDATLDSIAGLEAANAAQPTEIQYTVTGIENGDDLLANDTTKTFQVTVTWVSQETDVIPTATTTKKATITLNYKQKTA